MNPLNNPYGRPKINPHQVAYDKLLEEFIDLGKKYLALEKKHKNVTDELTRTRSATSSIQIAALHSILDGGVNYITLLKNAFEASGLVIPNPIPPICDLSYEEAIMVIRYGNNKFRINKR